MIRIIKRYKNASGIVIKYLINENGTERYVDVSYVQSRYNFVINAFLLPSGEFRANKGERIETIVDDTSLMIRKQTKLDKSIKGDTNNVNYYGQEFINACKRIRKYAIGGKLVVDRRTHSSNNGKNKHLFKLIEVCGLSVDEFIKGYLSVLQPYSLEKFQPNKKLEKTDIWLKDVGYGVALVIKIDTVDESKPMVVSFHESNIRGSFSAGNKDFSDKLCAVLVDNVHEVQTGKYSVGYCIQRGFLRYFVKSHTTYYNNDVALVSHKDISDEFSMLMEDILTKLIQNYRDEIVEDESSVVISRKDFSKLSFMSLGYATVNNICLMIDLYAKYTDKASRSVLVEMTNNILYEMPEYKLNELKTALADKYTNSNNELYLTIKDI